MTETIDRSRSPQDARPPIWSRAGGAFWKFLNSTIFIALLGAVAANLLTDHYATIHAEASDHAARRAQLSELVVELKLRLARLKVIREQWDGRAKLSDAELRNDGARAIAIVEGNEHTVTSNPEFRNEHMVSVLSRAEFAAGLDPSDKDFLLTFTDLFDCGAAAQVGYTHARLLYLVSFLDAALRDGNLPFHSARTAADTREAQVYNSVGDLSRSRAASLDVLADQRRAARDEKFLESCRSS